MGSLIGRPTNLGSNYWIDVQDGKIPGKSLVGVTGVREGLTDTAFVDVIEPGVTPGLATSAESLEVVSDSAEDGAGGSTGLLALVLFGLDANYDEAIPALVITSGATPVAVPGTYLATRQMIIVGSGTTKRNVGTINLNVVGDASTVRLQMLPERSNTFSSIATSMANASGV